MCLFLWQHHIQAQGPGGAEPGHGGVSGPAVDSVSGTLRRGVALGAGRRGPAAGYWSGTWWHRHLQGRLQPSQQVLKDITFHIHVCGGGRLFSSFLQTRTSFQGLPCFISAHLALNTDQGPSPCWWKATTTVFLFLGWWAVLHFWPTLVKA